jgi:hypothetical protein
VAKARYDCLITAYYCEAVFGAARRALDCFPSWALLSSAEEAEAASSEQRSEQRREPPPGSPRRRHGRHGVPAPAEKQEQEQGR